jgi:hypothetical protein
MKRNTDTSTQLQAKSKEPKSQERLEMEKAWLARKGLMYDENGQIVGMPEKEGYTTLY